MSLVTRKTCFLGFLPGTTQAVLQVKHKCFYVYLIVQGSFSTLDFCRSDIIFTLIYKESVITLMYVEWSICSWTHDINWKLLKAKPIAQIVVMLGYFMTCMLITCNSNQRVAKQLSLKLVEVAPARHVSDVSVHKIAFSGIKQQY